MVGPNRLCRVGADGAEAGSPAVSYRPGTWMAVVAPGIWLLVDAGPKEPLLRRAWEIAGGADGVEQIERLVRAEVATTPRHLLLAVADGNGLIVLLAGEGVAVVGPGPAGEMRCPTGVLIAEYRLARHPARLVLRGGRRAEEVGLPIASGIARAAEVRLDWVAVADEDEDKEQPSSAVAPAGPIGFVAADPDSTLLPPSIEEPAVVDAGPDEPGTDRSEPGQPARAPVAGVMADDADEGYDHLFGRTLSRTVEDAAVRGEEPVAGPVEPSPISGAAALARAVVASAPDLPAESPAVVAPAGTRPAREPPTPTPPLVRASTTGLIDAVPWSATGDSPAVAMPGASGPPLSPDSHLSSALHPSPAMPVTPVEPDEVGLTVSRAAQKALLEQFAALPTSPGGPTVHAVRCPAQHPNPAHAGTCRICGAPIDEQLPVTVPRPVLGRLRLSTGDEVSLDRGVLMGRGPTEGRHVGGERPHVVKLASAGHDISRNHLEVRLDGWHVLVTDLDSTNGTLVTRPGRPPERLRPDQPSMIEPGTVVSLADVTFTYEVT